MFSSIYNHPITAERYCGVMGGYQFKTFNKSDCPIGYEKNIQTLEQRKKALCGVTRPVMDPAANYLTITSEEVISTTPAKFMDFFLNTPGEKLVPGISSVPAITGSLLISETWGQPGSRRVLQDANGDDTLDELISVSDHCVEYMGFHFTGQGRKVMHFVVGRVELNEIGENQIKVTWTKSLRLAG